jgi:hypothetical protein
MGHGRDPDDGVDAIRMQQGQHDDARAVFHALFPTSAMFVMPEVRIRKN